MAITAAEIHEQSFAIDRKGYDVDEVDVFLEHVAEEIDNLNAQIADLEAQLDEAESAASAAMASERRPSDESASMASRAELARKDARITELESELQNKHADDRAIAQALIIAQRAADDITDRATKQANETIQAAKDEAQRIIDRANDDRQSVLDTIRKLQDDREDARMEYSDMLKDIIADASRKLSTLGTTTEFVAADAAGSHRAAPKVQAAPVSANDLTDEFEILDLDEAVAEYTTPQKGDTAVAAREPVASVYQKDLSGFGDADESIDLDDID